MLSSRLLLNLALALMLSGISCAKSASNAMMSDNTPDPGAGVESAESNPFFVESTLYFKLPPFDQIKNPDYVPAFERGMAEQQAEIEAIANQTAAPTLENTLIAMEHSGQILQRVSAVFFSLTSAHTNDTLEAIRSEMALRLSAHWD